jgi:hypothetical protein
MGWCCVVLRGAAWCCVVLRGAAWCCVVLRGAAWCCNLKCSHSFKIASVCGEVMLLYLLIKDIWRKYGPRTMHKKQCLSKLDGSGF